MPVEQEEANEEEVFEFDCPECGAHIVGEAAKCPDCGTEFVIEEIPVIECPSCGETCSVEAVNCPACGASLVEEGDDELRQEFPLLVAEVKPLLMISQDHGVDVGEGRRLIDKAIRAGKQRDLDKAVQMVKEARSSIKATIEARLENDEQSLERLASVVERSGNDPNEVKGAIAELRSMRDEGDLEGALEAAAKGRRTAERVSGKYIEASEMVDSLSRLIEVSDRFYLDVREAKRMLKEAQDAGDQGDWGMMGIVARKGREQLLHGLPEATRSEMRKAKNQLLDAKAEGRDVRTLVKMLKEAGVAMNRGKYDEALDMLSEFKDELKNL